MGITKAERLPDITRMSFASELILEIRDALQESLEQGQAFKIDELVDDKSFHNMQQRVRTQAKKMGINASVRRAKEEDALYFVAVDDKRIKDNAKDLDLSFDSEI